MIALVINYIKVAHNEAGWVNKAREFHSTNASQAPGQAFAKYQEYLSELDTFLTSNPFHNKFRNELKSVFEMSQDDSRLTISKKTRIVDKFASNYKFLLPEKQAVEKD